MEIKASAEPPQPPPDTPAASFSSESIDATGGSDDTWEWEDVYYLNAFTERQGDSSRPKHASSSTRHQRRRSRNLRLKTLIRIPRFRREKIHFNVTGKKYEDETRQTILEEEEVAKIIQLENLAPDAERDTIANFSDLCAHILQHRKLYSIVALGIAMFLVVLSQPTLFVAFRPPCGVPGAPGRSLCSYNQPQGHADYARLIGLQSRTFDKLLTDSSDFTSLSMDIKKFEMATKDLSTLVRESRLASKDMLAYTLDQFVSDAKEAGKSLQRFNAKVGTAVDSILAVNHWALKTIEAAESSTSYGPLISALMPWTPTQASVDSIVERTFTDSMSTTSTNLQRLVLEAEISLDLLNSLEEKLNTLYSIVQRENIIQQEEKDEILKLLWTQLGGNTEKLKGLDSHLSLLSDLHIYRRKARAHIVGAVEVLGQMSEDIEDLRENASMPQLDNSGIPLRVHIESIQMGLERLMDGRQRANMIKQAVVKRMLSDAD